MSGFCLPVRLCWLFSKPSATIHSCFQVNVTGFTCENGYSLLFCLFKWVLRLNLFVLHSVSRSINKTEQYNFLSKKKDFLNIFNIFCTSLLLKCVTFDVVFYIKNSCCVTLQTFFPFFRLSFCLFISLSGCNIFCFSVSLSLICH